MHRSQPTLGGGFFLLTLILSFVLARPAAAQVERSVSSFYGKFGVGLADYTGDYPIQTWAHPLDFQEFSRGSGFPLMTVGELGYRFSSAFGLALGFQGGNYPISGYAGGSGVTDSDRYTTQLLARYTFGRSDQRVAPYLDGGVNATFGGYHRTTRAGFGPSIGGGVDVRLGRTLSLYVESRFNLTVPDAAIDGASGTGALPGSVTNKTNDPAGSITGPFDAVNQLIGFGLKVHFGGSSGSRPLPEGPGPRPRSASAPVSSEPLSTSGMAPSDSARSPAAFGDMLDAPGSSSASPGISAKMAVESPPAEPTAGQWRIVVGSFEHGEGAQRVLQYYRNRSDLTLRPVEAAAGEPEEGLRFRVVVGRFGSLEAARTAVREHEAELPQGAWLLRLR